MNNKLNNMLNEFMEGAEIKDEEELNKKLQEFISKYNNNEIKYENTPLDNAYELLEKAEQAKTAKEAKKLAKQAHELCPECLDAVLLQADLEENSLKRMKILEEGLENEKSRLKKEGFFEKENIGHFYSIFETRPYIRGLFQKTMHLLEDGKLKKARDLCKEILKLNESDNTGARYLLMAIYATLEEEKEMLKLYKKYKEDNLEMLFPLFVLYYKLENNEKAIEYLTKINKKNPHFIKFFKGTLKEDNMPEGYFSPGSASEVIMYMNTYVFLLITIPNIDEYILENSKKRK